MFHGKPAMTKADREELRALAQGMEEHTASLVLGLLDQFSARENEHATKLQGLRDYLVPAPCGSHMRHTVDLRVSEFSFRRTLNQLIADSDQVGA